MSRFFTLIILSLSALYLQASTPAPKYEMRAVWLTTNWGLDWPSAPARNLREAEKQQIELSQLLDHVASIGINTVFFQARIRGEVFYPSAIEPWSAIVSGTAGKSPGYDPLAFVIDECHKRGMECHAWMVSIPTGSLRQAKRQGKRAVPTQHPELCVKLKGNWYLNPGHPGTATYLAQLAHEIVSHYDVDGIHLDYIRYPDEEGQFPDKETYKQYAPKGTSLKEWRKENISRIVATVRERVKAIKEHVMVSTAPLGRYTSLPNQRHTEWTCTGGVAQDAIAWMQHGDNDFVAPMMYYKDENYFPYLVDWIERTGDDGFVVAGLGAYRLEATEGNWSLQEIEQQIAASRDYRAGGQAYFRLQQLLRFPDLAHLLAGKYYRYPALIPPMRRASGTPPQAVEQLQYHDGLHRDTLTWQPSASAVRYAIYASVTDTVDTGNPTQLIATWMTDTMIELPAHTYRSFAVTAIDAYRRESKARYSHKNIISLPENESIEQWFRQKRTNKTIIKR